MTIESTIQTSTNTCAQLNLNRNPISYRTLNSSIVNIQLNIVTCPTYPEKFIRDNVVARFVPTSIVHNCRTAVSFGDNTLVILFEGIKSGATNEASVNDNIILPTAWPWSVCNAIQCK